MKHYKILYKDTLGYCTTVIEAQSLDDFLIQYFNFCKTLKNNEVLEIEEV